VQPGGRGIYLVLSGLHVADLPCCFVFNELLPWRSRWLLLLALLVIFFGDLSTLLTTSYCIYPVFVTVVAVRSVLYYRFILAIKRKSSASLASTIIYGQCALSFNYSGNCCLDTSINSQYTHCTAVYRRQYVAVGLRLSRAVIVPLTIYPLVDLILLSTIRCPIADSG